METKRKIELVVFSDVHLGTYGASAKELNHYLKTIDPGKVIINGDWLDIWNFDANYWPPAHTENIFLVFEFLNKGTPVYYLTGNHDDDLRKFSNYQFDKLELMDELILDLDGQKHWFLHGDQYDKSVGDKAKWLAKLGGKSYDQMIRFNRKVNELLENAGQERIMFSKMIKDNVKKIVKSNVSDFEQLACEEGIRRGYDYVICGHVHRPQMRKVSNGQGSVMYLNSGDWVENCTSLEYNDGKWRVFDYYAELHHTHKRAAFSA